MDIEFTLNFGKHKGKKIIDVWKGNYRQINNDIIKKYLEDFFKYLFDKIDFNEKILTNSYSLTDKDVEFVLFLRENNNYFDCIKVDKSQILINMPDENIKSKLIEFLITFFNHSHYSEPDFNALKHPENENLKEMCFTKYSRDLVELIPDHAYIIWLINNVEKFYK